MTATATTQPEYPNNYFYDGSSGNSRFNFSPGSSIANVFTARAGNGNAEALGEIVVAANSDNAVYEIQVYTNLSNPSEPTSGIPAFNEPLVYEQPIAGVATIRIPEVTIVQNTSYSIVLKTRKTAEPFPISARQIQLKPHGFILMQELKQDRAFCVMQAARHGVTWLPAN